MKIVWAKCSIRDPEKVEEKAKRLEYVSNEIGFDKTVFSIENFFFYEKN